jgi:hypothetical protein
VSQFSAIRTYVLTDTIECQEEIPDITLGVIRNDNWLKNSPASIVLPSSLIKYSSILILLSLSYCQIFLLSCHNMFIVLETMADDLPFSVTVIFEVPKFIKNQRFL